MAIHPTAIVDKNAKIGKGNEIGPYVIIEGNAVIGDNNHIYPHAFIGENTTIGNNNEIHMGAVIGHFPQDKAFKKDSKTFLVVGDNNTFREYVTIHRGTEPESTTKIGNGCLIMGGAHIAHDCQVGNNVIMANMSGIAGYVEIEDGAILSGGSMVHQFVRIGKMAILSGNCRINMDVPPFLIAGERNQTWGVNIVGLKRAGFSKQQIRDLRKLYSLFTQTGSRQKMLDGINEEDFSESKEFVDHFVSFVEKSKRGTCFAVKQTKE
ncbi:acyl-ACP--UDP-N-acetylglucosamine O-acyltransferase [Candidatus Uabimicrobium amorphum]|uniref:Acyl-[acyl-carrier-protein]--UDP-N-acetylglucosamine O-acyltransferase n=1 Tax=Uabimicrobium amorphum TaxID=2596890 RepID=A0A5S9F697_UABAM|nr:acyl-ACP--UDP-N-acetylglucosamine O-acyltransferase [Candidatus Uabimicrobium amorphum]BBM87665.1 acyl-[acyl-carrier-protein]--UDP-N-acetylglucosamine O-acyltransferase [Candidatus Uabimicrobium amorphum]